VSFSQSEWRWYYLGLVEFGMGLRELETQFLAEQMRVVSRRTNGGDVPWSGLSLGFGRLSSKHSFLQSEWGVSFLYSDWRWYYLGQVSLE